MASISVTVNFSYANLTTGRITATPKETFIDGTGKLVLGGIPFPSVNIASGAASIVLPSTKDFGIAYKFVIESGTTPTFTKIDEFEVVLDNVTPQNGNTLFTSFFSPDTLDTSVQTIADLLTKTPYLDRLAQRIPGFSFKTWTATQSFVKNDFTFRGARLYQWIKNTSGTNIDPLNSGNYTDPGNLLDGTVNANASWLVATSSLVGAGTSTTVLAYDNATFANLSTQPASRQNLKQLEDLIRASIAAPDLSAYARKDQSNSFSVSQIFAQGGTVPDLLNTDNSSSIVNSRTLRNIVGSSSLSANLNARFSILEERQNPGVNAALVAGVNTRQLNTIQQNPGADIVSLTNSVVTVKSGSYLVFASAMANRCGGSKLYVWNEATATSYSTRSMSSYTGENLANVNQSNNSETSLWDVITFGNNATLSLRQIVEVGGGGAGGVAANRPGYSELFSRLVLFRLS
jgi:hypothetical protein